MGIAWGRGEQLHRLARLDEDTDAQLQPVGPGGGVGEEGRKAQEGCIDQRGEQVSVFFKQLIPSKPTVCRLPNLQRTGPLLTRPLVRLLKDDSPMVQAAALNKLGNTLKCLVRVGRWCK